MSDSNLTAKSAALQAIDSISIGPTGLVQYVSRGRVLLIGGEFAAELAPRLSVAELSVQILLTEGEADTALALVQQGNRQTKLSGYLGNFKLELGNPGKPNWEVVKTDLVLDLGKTPLLQAALKPPGYFNANVDDETEISAAIQALSEMTGTFEKPRYFDYDSSICAHSRSGLAGCNACIDACPADAIISLTEKIEVNPNLCQGGGVCATVCPTGAIQYTYPLREDSISRLHCLISSYRETGGENPQIAIVADEDSAVIEDLPDNQLPLVVEELASVGLETWLTALAMGAEKILLYQVSPLPEGVAKNLRRQLDITIAILTGLGYPAGAIAWINQDSREQDAGEQMPVGLKMPRGQFTQKRQHAYNAIDYLAQQAELPDSIVSLPQGAPFGRIQVDKEACTLCLACTTVCPAQAVRAGKEAPRLLLHERDCVQCGLCAEACPENAILLEARLITEADVRLRAQVLHEEDPFCCISCGKAFASKSSIATIIEKLSGHQMYQSDKAKLRLKMCEDCRVVDIVQDDEMMGQPKLSV